MIDAADPLPPSPLTDWELTAIAARMVQRPDCNIYVAEQIGRLALEDDAEGVATWKAVARKVQEIDWAMAGRHGASAPNGFCVTLV